MSAITTDNLCFIHIPKCAGTSVFTVLEKKLDAKYNNKQLYDRHPTWKNILDVVGPEKYNQLYKFTIVRNPITLFISLFNYIFHYNTPTDQIRPLIKGGKTIQYVLDYINDNRDMQITNHGKNANIAMKELPIFHQHRFIYDDDDKLMVDKIFKFENINEVEAFLQHRGYGKLPHKLALSPPKKEMEQKYQDIIYSLAQKDFKLFGYEFI